MEKQNYALGMIETIGFPALVAAADEASKAANVNIATYQGADAGIVTIYIVGDVASVQSAVHVGEVAAKRVGRLNLSHVIARPDENVKKMIFQVLSDTKSKVQNSPPIKKEELPKAKVNKENSDNLTGLTKKNVQELRNIALSNKNFPLSADEISKAKKDELIKHLSATQAKKGGDK